MENADLLIRALLSLVFSFSLHLRCQCESVHLPAQFNQKFPARMYTFILHLTVKKHCVCAVTVEKEKSPTKATEISEFLI